MSEITAELEGIAEGIVAEPDVPAGEPESAEPAPTEAPEGQPEQPAAVSPYEAARATRDKAIEIFEQGPDAEGFEEAAAYLDDLGMLVPIDEDEGDEGDDEPISFDPDDYESPELAKIAELEARLNAKDEAERTAAEEAQREQAIQMFAADMKEATGEDIDVENPDKWTPEQTILGSLGLQLGSVAEAKKMLAERDGQLKKDAIAAYIDGKSDVKLPPETNRTATENKSPGNQTARAELADVGRRIIHGQQ